MPKPLTHSDAHQIFLFRSVSWLGSLGFLSAGLVGAQTAAAPEGAKTPIAPAKPSLEGVPLETGYESAPVPEQAPVDSYPVESAPVESYSENNYSEPDIAPSGEEAAPVPETWENPKSEVYTAPEPQPEPAPDYSHSYIDSTNYDLGATTPYDNPPAVVIQERSTGCEAVISGGSVPGNVCAATDPAPTTAPPPGTPQSGNALPNGLLPGNTAATPNSPSSEVGLPAAALPAVGLPSETPTYPVAGESTAGYYSAGDSASVDYSLAEVAYPVSEFPAMNLGMFQVGANGLVLDIRRGDSSALYNRFFNPEAIALRNSSIRLTALPGNGNIGIIFPLSIPAPITSAFGWRIHPVAGSSRFHAGTDLGAPTGTPVVAALAGQVSVANFLGGYGLTVVLQHEKATKETLYAHLSEILVEQGKEVKQGEVIGLVGSTGLSTGPHLHFEVRKLTPEGWVNLDPGGQLEYALAQMVNNFRTTQANASLKRLKSGSIDPKSTEESVEDANWETEEFADEELGENVELETPEMEIEE